MRNTGILSFFTRSRTAQLFLGVLFLWSLLPQPAANGNVDLNGTGQREYFAQGQASSLPAVADHRGKHSADQQTHAFARTPQDALGAFEHTVSAERATVVRTFTPFPAYVINTEHTSSDL